MLIAFDYPEGWVNVELVEVLADEALTKRVNGADVGRVQKTAVKRAPVAAKITGVKRVVHGHTHKEGYRLYKGIEVLNNGTWSPAFHDVECTQPYGRKCFTWIRPKGPDDAGAGNENTGRISTLYEWKDPGMEEIPMGGEEHV